jgi:hypothetical protein
MKIVSVILMLAYLMLPALCFGHPCDDLFADTQHSNAAGAPSDNPPVEYDSDDCEAGICCAGHLPATSNPLRYLGFTDKLLSHEPPLALPRIVYRIFVPPQNHPEITRYA